MSEREYSYEPVARKLPRLNWENLAREVEVAPEKVQDLTNRLEKALNQEAAFEPWEVDRLSEFIWQSVMEICNVAGLQPPTLIKVRRALKSTNLAEGQYRSNKQGGQLELSGSFLQRILEVLRSTDQKIADRDALLEELQHIVSHEVTDPGEQELVDYLESEIEALEQALLLASDQLLALYDLIAHEMYHSRQAQFDPDYYARTTKANMAALLRGRKQFELPFEYATDQGEMAAVAFGLRATIEKRNIVALNGTGSVLFDSLLLTAQWTGEQSLRELKARRWRARYAKKRVGLPHPILTDEIE